MLRRTMRAVDTTPAGDRRARRSSLSGTRALVCVAAVVTSIATGPLPGASAIVSPVNEPGQANAPYAVAILANLDAGVYDPQPFCSGALIAPDLVLTAAHCAYDFESASLFVGAGSENLFDVTLHPVADLVAHPEYDPPDGPSLNPLANDIALLRLAAPVKGASVVRLAPPKDGPLRGPRSNLRVHGWGIGADGTASEWLGRAVQTDITASTPSPYAELDIARQLLARSRRGSIPCVGDSGGPLVGNRPGKNIPVLVGLVSYGSDECDPRMPIVYTRIAGQRTWIERATQTLRGRTTKTRLTYRSTDRSWSAPEGTPLLTGELIVTRERVRMSLTAPDLGASREPHLVVRTPSNGAVVRGGSLSGGPLGSCTVEHGTGRVGGDRVWWVELPPSCMGLGPAGTDVLAELVRDGDVLEEIHFTRVRTP